MTTPEHQDLRPACCHGDTTQLKVRNLNLLRRNDPRLVTCDTWNVSEELSCLCFAEEDYPVGEKLTMKARVFEPRTKVASDGAPCGLIRSRK